MSVIYFLLMLLCFMWLAACVGGLAFLLVAMVEWGKKYKSSGWLLTVILTVLLMVGTHWGTERAREIIGAMEEYHQSQLQSE